MFHRFTAALPPPSIFCSGMNVQILQGVVQGAGCEDEGLEIEDQVGAAAAAQGRRGLLLVGQRSGVCQGGGLEIEEQLGGWG